jgi:hypothetical protein
LTQLTGAYLLPEMRLRTGQTSPENKRMVANQGLEPRTCGL